MTTPVINAVAPGSFAAVASTGKAFIMTHPIGMAAVGGAVVGTSGYIMMRRYFANRKLRKEALRNNELAAA